MKHLLFSVALLATLISPATSFACAWDRDTLEAEAKGIPDVIKVIAGRFERNPPLYYQMRLKRVAAQLQTNPTKLEYYDDAAVASDRIGKSRQAIEWIEKKKLQLQPFQSADANHREHWYRYYANAGTFYAHAWLHEGANRAKISDLEKARDYIAKAIEINPDAHFGREKYQLKAIQGMIKPPWTTDDDGLSNLLEPIGSRVHVENKTEAVKGISGLIALGNAWESVDVFNALAKAVQSNERRSSASYLALLRATELVDTGKKSVIPTAPTGKKLSSLILEANMFVTDNNAEKIKSTFAQLRAEANEWHIKRTDYMNSKLRKGQHPDTHPDFWKDYHEVAAPDIYGDSQENNRGRAWLTLGAVLAGSLLFVFKFRARWQTKA